MCVEKLTTALREHLETLSELYPSEVSEVQQQQQTEHDKGPWSETICKMIMNLESWAVRSPYGKVMGDARLRKKIMNCLDIAFAFGLVDQQSLHQSQQQQQQQQQHQHHLSNQEVVGSAVNSSNDKKESTSSSNNGSNSSAINLNVSNKSKSMEPLVANRIYGSSNNDLEVCKANIRVINHINLLVRKEIFQLLCRKWLG